LQSFIVTKLTHFTWTKFVYKSHCTEMHMASMDML